MSECFAGGRSERCCGSRAEGQDGVNVIGGRLTMFDPTVLALVFSKIESEARKAPRYDAEMGGYVLECGTFLKSLCVFLVISSSLLFLWLGWLALTASMGAVVMAIWAFFSRVILSSKEIVSCSALQKPRSILWEEITEVECPHGAAIVIRSAETTICVSSWLVGIQLLALAVQKGIEPRRWAKAKDGFNRLGV